MENRSNVQQVRGYYEIAAAPYERWGGKYAALHMGFYPDPEVLDDHFESVRRLSRLVIERGGELADGMKVLDAGCGRGSILSELATYGKKIEVQGINVAENQIRDAQERIAETGNGRTYLSMQDYTRVGFQSMYFDRVIMCESFFHAWNKEEVLKEMGRVLKPGGNLVIADFFVRDDLLPEVKGGRLKIIDEGWAGNFSGTEETMAILRAEGFDVSFDDITGNVLPSMRLAADSCREHEGDSGVSEGIRDHRLATIALEQAMIGGEAKYCLIRAAKTVNI